MPTALPPKPGQTPTTLFLIRIICSGKRAQKVDLQPAMHTASPCAAHVTFFPISSVKSVPLHTNTPRPGEYFFPIPFHGGFLHQLRCWRPTLAHQHNQHPGNTLGLFLPGTSRRNHFLFYFSVYVRFIVMGCHSGEGYTIHFPKEISA